MTLSIKRDGAWIALTYGETVVNADGIAASYETVRGWSVEDQEAFGVFDAPEPDAPPAGKIEASRELGGDDRPVWVVTYADAPPVVERVPDQVPMWAAQAALKQAGAYDAINKAILQMEATNAPVFFAWTMGNFASRQSTFIGTLGSQFGMSEADIDAVFRAADQIAQVAG